MRLAVPMATPPCQCPAHKNRSGWPGSWFTSRDKARDGERRGWARRARGVRAAVCAGSRRGGPLTSAADGGAWCGGALGCRWCPWARRATQTEDRKAAAAFVDPARRGRARGGGKPW